ncbi:MAG TPA: RraA family protein [Candidatus Sulfotelmatobacter sp.]|jgi:regulator of RNase E activity RraA
MAVAPLLTEEELDALRQFDTCMVANAVETFNVRLRNTGFSDASIRSMFYEGSCNEGSCNDPSSKVTFSAAPPIGAVPPMVGYAVTARLRSGEPPMRGGTFHDRADFWNYILQCPAPRVLVLQDMDNPPGRGAFVGDMHAAILKALGCIGYLTNGAVREVSSVRTMGFRLFAGSVAVSHAYAHIFDFGAKITVGGLEVHPGELLHGDANGVLSIPLQIASRIPAVAAELRAAEQKVIDFCQSSAFSVAKLGEIMKKIL